MPWWAYAILGLMISVLGGLIGAGLASLYFERQQNKRL